MKMTKILLSFLFAFLSISGYSQKIYFIYLQTDNEQPFYVRMDKSVHSSSAAGYLILPRLKDSTYNLNIGFPQNKWPEQKFTVTIGKKDHGYLLKNFGEKGWGLFDLQTMVVQMSSGASAKIELPDESKDISLFTNILAKAAGDPSIKETVITASSEKGIGTSVKENESKKEISIEAKNTIAEKPVDKPAEANVKKEEAKVESITEPSKELEKTEKIGIVKEEPEVEAKEQSKINTELITPETYVYKPSIVMKSSQTQMPEGHGIIFIDQNSKGVIDTISLVIPNPTPLVTPVETSKKDEKKFIDILPDSVKMSDEKPAAKTSTQVYREMNYCPSLARDNDFFKLRKLMAAAEGDENMLSEAKKYFAAKCFTTQQIKNLGSLFLTDSGKYKFFETAYNYVVDKNKFDSLQTEIKDEYYINLFNAMTRN